MPLEMHLGEALGYILETYEDGVGVNDTPEHQLHVIQQIAEKALDPDHVIVPWTSRDTNNARREPFSTGVRDLNAIMHGAKCLGFARSASTARAFVDAANAEASHALDYPLNAGDRVIAFDGTEQGTVVEPPLVGVHWDGDPPGNVTKEKLGGVRGVRASDSAPNTCQYCTSSVAAPHNTCASCAAERAP